MSLAVSKCSLIQNTCRSYDDPRSTNQNLCAEVLGGTRAARAGSRRVPEVSPPQGLGYNTPYNSLYYFRYLYDAIVTMLYPSNRKSLMGSEVSWSGQEQPPMSLARRANVGEKQLERLLAQASGGNNTSLVAAV